MLSSAYLHNESLLFVFAGPTASGKSSISQAIVAKDPTLRLSVSTTTRAIRGQEVDGKEYFFVTREEFQEKIDEGEFLEYASFGENMYGTQKSQLDDDGLSDIVLDIEIQGVKQVASLYPSRCIVVFVVPPSFEVLEKRLRERGTETEEVIKRRLEIARTEFEELRKPENSNYLLVNDDLETAISEASQIINCERRKLSRIAPQVLDKFYERESE